MSQTSNSNKFLFFLNYIILPAFFIKLLWSISLFYLDKDLIVPHKYSSLRFNSHTRLAYKILDRDKKVKPKVIKVGKKITDFKLKGTYVDGENSFVIIEDAKKTEFIYMHEKYEGYELIQVYDNKAIFEKDGQAYELTMYKDDMKFSIPKSSAVKKKPNNYPVPMQIRREEIDYYTQHPVQIWNNIRINEFRTEDGLNFRIDYVRNGSIFSKIGLKAGDIITAIDGEIPQTLGDVMNIYSNIDDIKNLVLSIKRGNQEMDIDFKVKE